MLFIYTLRACSYEANRPAELARLAHALFPHKIFVAELSRAESAQRSTMGKKIW